MADIRMIHPGGFPIILQIRMICPTPPPLYPTPKLLDDLPPETFQLFDIYHNIIIQICRMIYPGPRARVRAHGSLAQPLPGGGGGAAAGPGAHGPGPGPLGPGPDKSSCRSG